MTAILSGLSYSAVKRLKGSWVVSGTVCWGTADSQPYEREVVLVNCIIILQKANDVLLSYYIFLSPLSSPLPSPPSSTVPTPSSHSLLNPRIFLSRLSFHQYVREKAYTQFMRLEKVMDPANNSSNYRTVLARVSRKEPCIPFFGEHIRRSSLLNQQELR